MKWMDFFVRQGAGPPPYGVYDKGLQRRMAEKGALSCHCFGGTGLLACGGWAETQAAYRFLARDDIEWEAILRPHWRSSNGQRDGLLESTRRTEGYARIAELAALSPDSRLVYVADREADIVALMAPGRDLGHPADTTPAYS